MIRDSHVTPGRLVLMLLAVFFVSAGTARGQAANLLVDPSWDSRVWNGAGNFVRPEIDGEGVLLIESASGGDLSWNTPATVKPNTRYTVTGMIRTEGVNAGSGRGALINIHTLAGAETRALTGNNEWTKVSLTFDSGDRDTVSINCLLGGWGESTGKAWYKDVTLTEAGPAGALEPITIDASRTGPEMSELIYGQFIEHLGRCIYGGIWAEMLEDRKFYFPVTARYAPYTRNQDAMFPIVGRSPWEIVGDAGLVTMVKQDSFVGDHTPKLADGATIRQHDLGVVEGKRYTGYIWLKAVAGRPSVTVSLDPAGEGESVRVRQGDYVRHAFAFTASGSTDEATLAIAVAGGDVMVGTVSLMPADNVEGMRADTLKLLKQLNSPLYRWPGGNFVSGYDWRDGIGDRDRRPPRTNPAWTGVEHNDFGTHEFIRLCELLSAEPLITTNMGFEGAFSAEAQMEYVNGKPDTYWGGRRAEDGRREPFGVKYWCIGNEMWGDWQLGFMSPEDYQIKHNWVVDRLRKKFPDFIAIGSGDAGDWSRGLLERSGDRMDLIAEHFYSQYREDVAQHVRQIPDNIRRKAEFHRQAQPQIESLGERRIPIAMTEWNYWYGPHPYGELGTVYYLRDALGIAAGIHEYARCSDIIGAAFYAQTVNVIGCIKTTKTDAFLAATALPLIMYREHFGTVPIPLDTGTAQSVGIDVAAAWTADRKAITIAVVNANAQPRELDLGLTGAEVGETAERWWFAGDNPQLTNDAEQDRLTIRHEAGVAVNGKVSVSGYSATIFRVPVK